MQTLSDMFSSEFGLELPDDIFVEEISQMFREDELINVLTTRPLLGDEECSRFCQFDYEKGEIHVGMKKFSEPFYVPLEDFCGVDVVYDYVKKREKNVRCPFPDVPVAECGVPTNQHERPIEGYELETVMASKGFLLYNPTLGCRNTLNPYYVTVIDEEGFDFDGVNQEFSYDELPIVEERKKDLWFFLPYRDDNNPRGLNLITMQFNPFHPMAVDMIRSFNWVDEFMVEGEYMYRNVCTRFCFSLKDKRFRVHSNVWVQLLSSGCGDGVNEVFDLVSTKAFPFDSPLVDFKKFYDNESFIEPVIIEPIVTSGFAPFPYSIIGPFNSKIKRGFGYKYSSPCFRSSFDVQKLDKLEKYVDITDDVLNVTLHSFEYEGDKHFIEDKMARSNGYFVKIKKKIKTWDQKKKILDDQIKVQQLQIKLEQKHLEISKLKDSKIDQQVLADHLKDHEKLKKILQKKKKDEFYYKIYRRKREGDVKEKIEFFYTVGYKFLSFPRNVDPESGQISSIIYHYKVLTLMHALQFNKTNASIHEYLPLWSPNDFVAEDFDFVDNDGDYGGVGCETLYYGGIVPPGFEDCVDVNPLSPSDPGVNEIKDGVFYATRIDLGFDVNNPYVLDEDDLGLFSLPLSAMENNEEKFDDSSGES